jgi:hypothetical protein
MIREFYLSSIFSHNGYDYNVEVGIEKKIVVAALVEISKNSKGGGLVYKFKFIHGNLEQLPFIPKGLYDDSIVNALIPFLLQQPEITSLYFQLA